MPQGVLKPSLPALTPAKTPEVAARTEDQKPRAGSKGLTGASSRLRGSFGRLRTALRSGNLREIKEANDALGAELTPACPEETNGAPLYLKAFEKVTQIYREASLAEALAEVKVASRKRPLQLTADEQVLLRGYVEKNREAIELLKEASHRPNNVFLPGVEEGLDLSSARLQLITGFCGASRLLDVAANVSEGPERTELALAAGRLAAASSSDPSLVSQLVSRISQEIGVSILQETLASFPEESLLEICSSPGLDEIHASFERALYGEAYRATAELLKDSPRLNGKDLQSLKHPEAALDLAYFADTVGECAALLQRPYFEVRDQLQSLQMERVTGAPAYAELSKALLPGIIAAASYQAVNEGQAGTVQLAAALNLYQQRNGAYPSSLEDLRGVLPVLPIDPCSGKSFLYRREGAGFVVYSVGVNGMDDGGDAKEVRDVVFRPRR